MRIEAIGAALAAMALSGCATQLYERSVVVIDHYDTDAFEVRYADFDGCLVKQQVPVDYKLKRGLYTLRFEAPFGTTKAPPDLDVLLADAPGATLSFTGVGTVAPADELDGVRRYELKPDSTKKQIVGIDVARGSEVLGHETVRLEPQTCKAMSLGGTKAPQ
jgi:hypothetical protein